MSVLEFKLIKSSTTGHSELLSLAAMLTVHGFRTNIFEALRARFTPHNPCSFFVEGSGQYTHTGNTLILFLLQQTENV